MNYKIQHTGEFIKELSNIAFSSQELLLKTEQYIKNYDIKENINNPYKEFYISNTKIMDNILFINNVLINPEYSLFNVKQAIDVNMDKDDIIHTSYYENAFNYLNKIFVLNEELKTISFWKYKNAKNPFTNKEIPSLWWVKNNYFLNKNIVIDKLRILNKNTHLITINNALNYLNEKKSNNIETIINSVNQNNNVIYKQETLNTDKIIEIKCEKITISNKCNELLNEENCDFMLRRDLSNLTFKVKLSDSITSDESVLSKNKTELLLSNYRNKNDYIVNKSFYVDNSYDDDHIVNAISFFELLQSKIQNYLENIVYNYIVNGVQSKNPLELYYQSKIKEYKDKYVLLNSYVLTGIKITNNNCFQINNPLTLLEETNYCNNINIEKSNRALTKGVYKRWLSHMVKGKIQW